MSTPLRWLVMAGIVLGMLFVASFSQEAVARRVVHKSKAKKGKLHHPHVSPKQQKVRRQRHVSSLKRASRSPKRLRQRGSVSRRRKSRIITTRGPLRRPVRRRTKFTKRTQVQRRSYDRFGRWIRSDPYSLR